MNEMSYYLLFYTHTDGLELYSLLKEEGYHIRISPAPRAATSCCGMSLLVSAEEIDGVRAFVEKSAVPLDRIVELENQIDPTRDTYC